jgi:hypothetical protein
MKCWICSTKEGLVKGANVCKPCHAASQRERRRADPMGAAEVNRRYRRKAKAKVLEAVKDWERRNPGKVRRTKQRRRTTQLRERAIRPDGDDELRYYRSAETLRALGLDVQVDHIVPLGGRDACGMHWAPNLRLSYGHANASKGARWFPRNNEPIMGQFVTHACPLAKGLAWMRWTARSRSSSACSSTLFALAHVRKSSTPAGAASGAKRRPNRGAGGATRNVVLCSSVISNDEQRSRGLREPKDRAGEGSGRI